MVAAAVPSLARNTRISLDDPADEHGSGSRNRPGERTEGHPLCQRSRPVRAVDRAHQVIERGEKNPLAVGGRAAADVGARPARTT